jgi:tetratricopeptide (TPR) repeat protein
MNAERLFLAGVSAYQRGERQVPARYCERALRESAPEDALTVRLSHLYLATTEMWWNSGVPLSQVRAIVDLAQQAAARAADPELQALATCLRGRYLIATNGLPEAVAVFDCAAKLADQSDGILAQLEALADLGHHSVGLNMNRGITVLRDALAAAERPVRAPAVDLPLIRIQQARIHGLIGVAAYDAGSFGEAESSLRRSIDGLASLRAWDQYAMIANYMAQLLTETGRFADAEAILHTALTPLQAHADLSMHQGYNLGLLGKCYLDWGKIDAAAAAITAGWDRVAASGHRGVLPILRNYLGELEMHPENPHRSLDRARDLFDETIAECRRTGFQRSEVGALALRALADLSAGRLTDALDASEGAVGRLEETGPLPALRSEEVYLTRYKVLHAAGASAEAAVWAARARQTIMAKARSLPSAQLREQFLAGTPVAREILAVPAPG